VDRQSWCLGSQRGVREGDTILPTGFPVLPRRWVVKRTTAWITHSRRLSRDGEGTQTSSEAFLSVVLTTRMVARRTRATASAVSFCTHSERARCPATMFHMEHLPRRRKPHGSLGQRLAFPFPSTLPCLRCFT